MLRELETGQFHRVIPILGDDSLSLEARSVAQGNSPGRIFSDCVEKPNIALVWSNGIGGFYLAGDPYLDQAGLRQAVLEDATSHGSGVVEISACSHGLDVQMAHVFENDTLESETGLIY